MTIERKGVILKGILALLVVLLFAGTVAIVSPVIQHAIFARNSSSAAGHSFVMGGYYNDTSGSQTIIVVFQSPYDTQRPGILQSISLEVVVPSGQTLSSVSIQGLNVPLKIEGPQNDGTHDRYTINQPLGLNLVIGPGIACAVIVKRNSTVGTWTAQGMVLGAYTADQ